MDLPAVLRFLLLVLYGAAASVRNLFTPLVKSQGKYFCPVAVKGARRIRLNDLTVPYGVNFIPTRTFIRVTSVVDPTSADQDDVADC